MSIDSATQTPSAATSLPVVDALTANGRMISLRRVALVGNPNAGKTTLFNRLTGLRAQTANFPGTTVEHRRARVSLSGTPVELVDLPGVYSLEAVTPDEQVACSMLLEQQTPDVMLLVVDATHLERNLFLASQLIEAAAERQRPVVVALNMSDLAKKHGLKIDPAKLAEQLGCAVVPVSARTGEGVDQLRQQIVEVFGEDTDRVAAKISTVCSCSNCAGCAYASRYDWAERVTQQTVVGGGATLGKTSEWLDRLLTHRVGGLAAFAAVMFLTFMLIYWVAQYPMGWIETLVSVTGGTIGSWLPEGEFRSLLTDGIVGGVGGMLVFLPQICLLFFMLALLEDSGYLARAAFVMDRLMQRVGLPGKAFVPMLSAHACAIPAIMATRVIDDRRDRLATILVLPLMTCSARVPVYAMVIAMLFPHEPLMAALVFSGAYGLGIVAALVMAWIFKHTLLPGETRPLVIELPNYKLPSLRNAWLQMLDRAAVFIKNAGTTILVICVLMWALATYPRTSVEDLPAPLQTEIAQLTTAGDTAAAENILAQQSLERSLAGRIGHAIEPIFAPLGFDWKTSIGVVSSFAAREVIVSTLSVLYGLGEEGEGETIVEALQASTHADGTPVFTTAACLSLLVFYVLAMQCLPTQVVTKRETGSWGWAAFQFSYMSLLAYVAALVTYQVAAACGLA